MSQEFHDDLSGQLRARLTALAPNITSRAPGTRFHLEFPLSRIYEFVGLLIFTHEDNPTTEDAVLSVELTRHPAPKWTIDIVGKDSLALSELGDLAPDLQESMAADAAVAADVVADFLRENVDAIVKELGQR